MRLEWRQEAGGRWTMQEIAGSDTVLPVELARLALGFVHPAHEGMPQQLGVALDSQGNVRVHTDAYQTSRNQVFMTGDRRRGQSLPPGRGQRRLRTRQRPLPKAGPRSIPAHPIKGAKTVSRMVNYAGGRWGWSKAIYYCWSRIPCTMTRTALAALEALPDKDIDYSDIPPLTDDFWKHAVRNLLYRPTKTSTTVRLDADVLQWLKSKGKGYQTRLNAILREAMLKELDQG